MILGGTGRRFLYRTTGRLSGDPEWDIKLRSPLNGHGMEIGWHDFNRLIANGETDVTRDSQPTTCEPKDAIDGPWRATSRLLRDAFHASSGCRLTCFPCQHCKELKC